MFIDFINLKIFEKNENAGNAKNSKNEKNAKNFKNAKYTENGPFAFLAFTLRI